MGITILISIIASAGLLGGLANYYMEQANGAGFRKSVLLGLTASATVPLFLKTVSSSLLDECIKGDPHSSYFVFFGFCTVAAMFSSKFLQSLADKLLQEIKEVKQKQEDIAETTGVLVDQNSDPSDAPAPVVDPSGGEDSEFESFKTGGSVSSRSASPPLPAMNDEQKVMSTLQTGKFAFRTVEGIAKDTNLDYGTVQAKLLELEAQGKVKKTKRARDGAMVWCSR